MSEADHGRKRGNKRKLQQLDDIVTGAGDDTEAFPRGGRNSAPPAGDAEETVKLAKPESLFKVTKADKSEPAKKKQRTSKSGKKGKKDKDLATKSLAPERTFDIGKAPRFAVTLSFKKLKVGMQLLGVVRSLRATTMAVSLPHNLTGFVSAENVSPLLAERCEAEQDDDDFEGMASVFTVGQTVQCVVVKLFPGEDRRRVELAVAPENVNAGRTLASLKAKQAIPATVKSKEDHGYVMNLGINGVNSFLPFDATTDSEGKQKELIPGQLVNCVVTETHAASRMVKLTADEAAVQAVRTKAMARVSSVPIAQLKPGMLLNTRVLAVIQGGLYVHFLGVFTGTVDLFHLLQPAADGWEKAYSAGQRLRCRVLFVDLPGKVIGLSAAPHMVKLQPVEFKGKFGAVWEDAKVLRLDSQGMLVGMMGKEEESEAEEVEGKEGGKIAWGATGYVHISRVADGRIDHLVKKFSVGQTVKGRIVGFSTADGIANLSLRPSVLNASILTYDDLTAGELQTGTVKSVGKFGMLVGFSDHVQGLVTPMHMADVAITRTKSRFKVGKKVKCRVLSVDSDNHRAHLSCKPTLLKTSLPVLTEYPGVGASKGTPALGSVVHGFVTAVRPAGVIVTFFNNVHGLVPKSDLAKLGVENVAASYPVGKPVKAKLKKCDRSRGRLLLSFRITTSGSSAVASAGANVGSFKPGMHVTGVVREANASGLVLDVTSPSGDTSVASLPATHLSSHSRFSKQLLETYQAGADFDTLVVLRVDPDGDAKGKASIVVSAQPLLINAPSEALPQSFDDLEVGRVVCGTVTQVTSFGVFVRFLGELSGMASRANVADAFVTDPTQHFQEGDSVRALVVSVDKARNQIGLSLKASVLASAESAVSSVAASEMYLRSLFTDEERVMDTESKGTDGESSGSDSEDEDAIADLRQKYATGSVHKATVEAVKPFGVVLSLKDGCSAFAVTKQVDDVAALKKGSKVKARVLDVDAITKAVNVSLQGRLVAASSTKRSTRKSKKATAAALKVGDAVKVQVELVQPGKYAVVSVPASGHTLGFAALADFNHPKQPLVPDSEAQEAIGSVMDAVVSSVTAGADTGSDILFQLAPAASKRRTKRTQAVAAPEPAVAAEKVQVGDVLSVIASGKAALGEDLALQLPGVSGSYKARLSLDECLDLDINGEDAPARPKLLKAFTGIKSGDKFDAKVVCVRSTSSTKRDKKTKKSSQRVTAHFVMSIRPAEMNAPAGQTVSLRGVVGPCPADAAAAAPEGNPVAASTVGFVAGAVATGIVLSASPAGLTVGFGGNVSGKVAPLATGSAEECGSAPVASRFKPGQTVRTVCLGGKPRKLKFTLCNVEDAIDAANAAFTKKASGKKKKGKAGSQLAAALAASLKAAQATESLGNSAIAVGGKVTGRVIMLEGEAEGSAAGRHRGKRSQLGCVVVDLGDNKRGVICITQLADKANWEDHPMRNLNIGQVVEAVVLRLRGDPSAAAAKPRTVAELSMRPSLLEAVASGEGKRKTRRSKSAGGLEAATIEKLLKEEAAATCEVGQVVTGYVVNTTPKGCFVRLAHGVTARVLVNQLADGFVKDINSAFPAGKLVAGRVTSFSKDTHRIELTLRQSRVLGTSGGELFGTLEKGQAFSARVTRVESYGVFAELLVPSGKGNLTPSGLTGLCHVKECADGFVQDLTKAYSLGDQVRVVVIALDQEKKRVSFSMKASHFENEEQSSDSDAEGSGEEAEAGDDVAVLEPVSGSDSDDDMAAARAMAAGSAGGDSDESGSDDGEDSDGDAEMGAEASSDEEEASASDSDEEPAAGKAALGVSGFDWGSSKAADEDVDMDSESSEDDSEDEDEGTSAGKGRKAKLASRKREEAAVRAKEMELVEGNVLPEAEADFERLIIAQPNNSFLWIKFMAFQLSRTEVDKARAIAKRALAAINYREEQEKLNIWVALLNLEHQYGDAESLATCFAQAQQSNDPKAVHQQLLQIYERAGDNAEADTLHAITAKKFGSSKAVWVDWARHRFRTKDLAGGRSLLPRAMKILPKRKHLETVSKFAIMEFKYGSTERGRTMFEGILSSYPKRIDMWNVYLDQEISLAGDDEEPKHVRRLFERAVSLKLSSKKARFFFDKWMKVEEKYGPEHVQAVAQRAKEYVQSVLQKA